MRSVLHMGHTLIIPKNGPLGGYRLMGVKLCVGLPTASRHDPNSRTATHHKLVLVE